MVRASDIARPLACDLLRDGVLDMDAREARRSNQQGLPGGYDGQHESVDGTMRSAPRGTPIMNGLDDLIRATIGLLFVGGASASASVAAARQSQGKAAKDLQDAIKKSREPHEVLNEIGGDGGPDAD